MFDKLILNTTLLSCQHNCKKTFVLLQCDCSFTAFFGNSVCPSCCAVCLVRVLYQNKLSYPQTFFIVE